MRSTSKLELYFKFSFMYFIRFQLHDMEKTGPNGNSEKTDKQKHQPNEKKLLHSLVPCVCWSKKVMSAGLDRVPEEKSSSKYMQDIFFHQVIQQRDQCEACQPEIPRTKEKCSCKVAYQYLINLLSPITRQLFPPSFQISCAQIDWAYERRRCIFCKDRASETKIESDFATIMKKKEQLGFRGWTFFSGVHLKALLKEVDDG